MTMSPRWIVGLCVTLVFAPVLSAQPKKDPLRFVPSQAELVVKVNHPRDLVEAVEKNELFLQAQKLAGVREYYDTTNFQQLYQLIAYFEKELGKERNEILDDIGAGGIVIAAKLTAPQGALLVVQSKDEAKLRKFVELALDIVGKELERQESKDKIVRKKYDRFDGGQIGPKLNFALADGALLISPDAMVLKMALDLQLKKEAGQSILQIPAFTDARKQAPAKALAWTWLHLEELRKDEKFKNGLDAAGLDPAQMLLFGGLADLLKRAPYVSAALTRDGPTDYRLGIQMPRGREGMAPLKHMITPADDNGTLPPLAPPRALASFSYFLDLGQFWEKRVEILGEKNAKGLDEGNQNVAKLLGNIKLSKLFQAAGPHHRLVFAQQKESPYKLKPATPFPAFALVIDMRDPGFAKDMNSIFRTGALLATFQIGLTLKETTYKDCDLVSYYFSETKKFEGDPTNARFNFNPTYVAVGDQFVMSATAELARDLIDVIKAERKAKPSKASMRTQVFASGFADIARANEDATLTQLILAQALPPKTAKEELRTILDWVDRLGSLRLEMTYGDSDFRYDILWKAKK
jgi:hypothetical protein